MSLNLIRYKVSLPIHTHRREATCAEVDCLHYLQGWKTIVPHDSPQAHYIRTRMNQGERPGTRGYRHFREEAPGLDGTVAFVFPPGQECFRDHTVPTGRPPHYVRATQDRQGHVDTRVLRPEDWIADSQEEFTRLRQFQERHA